MANYTKFSELAGANLQALMDLVYPVGVVYWQPATVDSDDPDTAMPSSAAPTALFGGTWTKLYDDEGIDFHTEGFDSSGAQARDASGVQADQMQGHYHRFNWITANGASQQSAVYASNGSGNQDVGRVFEAITDGTNGTPRTGTRTSDKNRWVRVWQRTA